MKCQFLSPSFKLSVVPLLLESLEFQYAQKSKLSLGLALTLAMTAAVVVCGQAFTRAGEALAVEVCVKVRQWERVGLDANVTVIVGAVVAMGLEADEDCITTTENSNPTPAYAHRLTSCGTTNRGSWICASTHAHEIIANGRIHFLCSCIPFRASLPLHSPSSPPPSTLFSGTNTSK